MPDYTDNNGNTYTNRNVCRSYNFSLTTALTGFRDQVCSEVIVFNRTGQDVNVFDSGYSLSANGFLLRNNEQFTFRGVTNAMQLSASTATGSGTLYYRTQYYSHSVQ